MFLWQECHLSPKEKENGTSFVLQTLFNCSVVHKTLDPLTQLQIVLNKKHSGKHQFFPDDMPTLSILLLLCDPLKNCNHTQSPMHLSKQSAGPLGLSKPWFSASFPCWTTIPEFHKASVGNPFIHFSFTERNFSTHNATLLLCNSAKSLHTSAKLNFPWDIPIGDEMP